MTHTKRSTPAGARRLRPGCREHGMSSSSIRRLWKRAGRVQRKVAMCECCTGPAVYVPLLLKDGNEMGANFRCTACGGPRRGASSMPSSGSALLDAARERAPVMRFTVRAKGEGEDVEFMRKVATLLKKHPGGNTVLMRVVEDESSVRLKWLAYTGGELRRELAGLLAGRMA